MFDADELQAVLDRDGGVLHRSGPFAAVASVWRDGDDGPEALFIERARHENDPWSGQMAFPGGRHETDDADLFETATRETLEEVGLDLSGARLLGSLAPLQGGRATRRLLTVRPHVYWWDGPRPPLTLNYEVADAPWISARELVDADNFVDYFYPTLNGHTWPAVSFGDGSRVVWGLTLRMLEDFFARLEISFEVRPPQ